MVERSEGLGRNQTPATYLRTIRMGVPSVVGDGSVLMSDPTRESHLQFHICVNAYDVSVIYECFVCAKTVVTRRPVT